MALRQKTIDSAFDPHRFPHRENGVRFIEQHERANHLCKARRHRRNLRNALNASAYGSEAALLQAETALIEAYNLAIAVRKATMFPTDGEARRSR